MSRGGRVKEDGVVIKELIDRKKNLANVQCRIDNFSCILKNVYETKRNWFIILLVYKSVANERFITAWKLFFLLVQVAAYGDCVSKCKIVWLLFSYFIFVLFNYIFFVLTQQIFSPIHFLQTPEISSLLSNLHYNEVTMA